MIPINQMRTSKILALRCCLRCPCAKSLTTAGVYSHRWMEALQNFRKEAMATSHQLKPDSNGETHMTKNPIKVALIDDGVNLKDLDHKGLVKDGWPLDISDEDKIVTTYYESTEGHGTVMANLIHFACPEAHLYVAKLEKPPPKVYKCVAGMAADVSNLAPLLPSFQDTITSKHLG